MTGAPTEPPAGPPVEPPREPNSGDARTEILARIRAAVAGSSQDPIERAYRQTGSHAPGSDAACELLVDRLIDYRAEVVRCADTDAAIATAIADTLAALGDRGMIAAADVHSPDQAVAEIVTAPGVPHAWWDTARRRDDDPPLSIAELDTMAGVLTGSSVAIAETGTIVLVAGPLTGRRAISLVPDLHLCVVRAADVVHSVPEGLARLDPNGPLTFISGPSATSDIELNRVEGVHGPRTLVVILAS